MRTDVKVGLISLFIIVLAIVGYFAWQNQRGSTKNTDVQPISEPGLVNRDTPGGLPAPVVPPAPRPMGTDGLSSSAVVIMPPQTGPAATTQALPGGVSAREAFAPIVPTPATAPGATYPANFGGGGGSASSVSIEPAGNKRAIDFGPAPSSDMTGNGATPSGSSASTGGYTVKKGDSFARIAKSLKTTVSALTAANPGVDSSRLKIGQTLTIPADAGAASSVTPAPSSSSGSSAAPSSGSTSGSSAARSDDSGKSAKPAGHPGTYVVKKGDTLTKIAKKFYGTEKAWPRIVRANRDLLNRDGSNLDVGMELRLPE